jgi:hypothetical protein
VHLEVTLNPRATPGDAVFRPLTSHCPRRCRHGRSGSPRSSTLHKASIDSGFVEHRRPELDHHTAWAGSRSGMHLPREQALPPAAQRVINGADRCTASPAIPTRGADLPPGGARWSDAAAAIRINSGSMIPIHAPEDGAH